MKIPTIDIERLRTFYVSAQTGKFSIAAEKLERDCSVITRQIQNLESDLKAILFYRNGRQGLTLTEQGEALFPLARDVFAKIAEIEPTLSATEESLSGSLRIWVYSGYALNFIRSCLVEFARRYPLIQLEVISTQDFKDVTIREVDVAIGPTLDTIVNSVELIQTELFRYTLKLYASQEYVKQYGFPKDAKDLRRHKLISFSSPIPKILFQRNWYLELEKGNILEPYFSSDSHFLIGDFIEAGMGIGSLCPSFSQIDTSKLVPILPEISGPTVSVLMSYGENFKHSQKIGAFHNFMLEKCEAFKGMQHS